MIIAKLDYFSFVGVGVEGKTFQNLVVPFFFHFDLEKPDTLTKGLACNYG